MFRKPMILLSLLAIVVLVLPGCSPAVQTVEIVKTQVVEIVKTELVDQTQVVEVERPSFSEPHPILSDLRVRQAMSYCTNKLDLVKAVYPLLKEEEQQALVMNTWIPRVQWAYAGDENVTIYPFDLEKGKALLDEAGWTQDDGAEFRTNADGATLAIKFSTTDATWRKTWSAVWEQQMRDCGIQIIRFHTPASWWFGDTTGLMRRDFELGAYSWVGQADPSGVSTYACDQIPTVENGWEGQNYMGWCNETAHQAIKDANNTLNQDERKAAYTIHQAEYTKDVPTIPLFNRTESYAYNPNMVGFDVKPGNENFFTYDLYQWEIPGKETFVLGEVQEPASLFPLVEDANVTRQVTGQIYGFTYTSPDYTYQPGIASLSTIESGMASNNIVEVKEGDMVWDSVGQVQPLAAGVKVVNADGETVEFASGTVQMKQIQANYEFIEGLTFSDGQPVKQEDYELGYKISCDPESGATGYTQCEAVNTITFNDRGYAITYQPGFQDPTYFLTYKDWLPYAPAHLVLSDGRKLADVPASEWTTLPEISETPMGAGPYMVTEWVKGEKIVLEANPYWAGEAPKMKTLVISIVSAENAIAQLLAGQVDMLDSITLSGLTETLVQAEQEGKVATRVIPGGTWEHIDFNMWLR